MLVKHEGKISAPKALCTEREGCEQATVQTWSFELSDKEVAEFAAAGVKLALSTALTQCYNKLNSEQAAKSWDALVAMLPQDRPLTTADFSALKAECGIGASVSVKDMSLTDIVMAKFGLTRAEAEKVARSMERSIGK